MAFQGTSDKAAVAGDFVMLADEVAPVIEALAGQNIEVVAVHNHMVHDTPRAYPQRGAFMMKIMHPAKLARHTQGVKDIACQVWCITHHAHILRDASAHDEDHTASEAGVTL